MSNLGSDILDVGEQKSVTNPKWIESWYEIAQHN